MNVLVVGGTGATGRLFVNDLLSRGHAVTVIVRSDRMIDAYFPGKERLTVLVGTALGMEASRLRELTQGFDAIGSCLGHTLTLKGIFGKPRRLVADSIERLCAAVRDTDRGKPVRLVLMGSTAVMNDDEGESRTPGEAAVMAILRRALPPQRDNELAAEYLRRSVGRGDGKVEWVIVRPDTLVDEAAASEYAVFASPTRSPIFDAGKTSRANVAAFMSRLISDDAAWLEWRGKMPVVYNASR